MIIGCTKHPAPGEKYCRLHKDVETPAILPVALSKETREQLNKQQSLENDMLFVVEGTLFYIDFLTLSTNISYCPLTLLALLVIMINKIICVFWFSEILEVKDERFLVKWERYKKPTWEPSRNMPMFIQNYVKVNLGINVGAQTFNIRSYNFKAGTIKVTWDTYNDTREGGLEMLQRKNKNQLLKFKLFFYIL